MTPTELEQRLTALFGPDRTTHKAAKALHVHERSVRKWLTGDRAVPGPVVAYLDLAARRSEETVFLLKTIEDLEANQTYHAL